VAAAAVLDLALDESPRVPAVPVVAVHLDAVTVATGPTLAGRTLSHQHRRHMWMSLEV
jgi:hypothetical protein